MVTFDPVRYHYINQGCLTADTIDDKEELIIADVSRGAIVQGLVPLHGALEWLWYVGQVPETERLSWLLTCPSSSFVCLYCVKACTVILLGNRICFYFGEKFKRSAVLHDRLHNVFSASGPEHQRLASLCVKTFYERFY